MLPAETIITTFLATTLAAIVLSKKTRTPYTLMLIFIGIVLAALSLSSTLGINQVYDELVGQGLLVGLVLPPLLFESMMAINPEELRAVARPALGLATFGVLVATVAGGLLLWLLGHIPIYSAFLFAALISPTDTATVLEVFRRVKVPSRLGTMMEVEAGFNDATGITVFAILLGLGESATGFPLLPALYKFLVVFGGGVLVGAAVALAARLVLRSLDDPIAEVILTLAAVYGSFSLADSLGVSGLVAVSVAGVSYGVATSNKESPERRESIRRFWAVLAFIANSAAFLIIGLSTDLYQLLVFIIPITIAYIAILAARFVSVFSVLGVSKVGGAGIPRSWKGVATLGGMRGAVSIVLAASLPATIAEHDLIAAAVLGVAFISIVLQGYLLTRYAKRSFPELNSTSEGAHGNAIDSET